MNGSNRNQQFENIASVVCIVTCVLLFVVFFWTMSARNRNNPWATPSGQRAK